MKQKFAVLNYSNLSYRWMEQNEVTKIADIDRTERIRTGYQYSGGELYQRDVIWDAPPWNVDGGGAYSVAEYISSCREHLNRNGRMYGAFDGEQLVGIGLIEQEIRPGMAELAFLHVSNGYRRHGIGERIATELVREAKMAGANKMYVSATPSGSAVGFYLSLGFEPTEIPLPELFELEPDDIHMIKELL